MSVPFIYPKGSLVNSDKENSNHRYLKKIVLETHDHSIDGEGGDLENIINHGPYKTKYLKNRQDLTLTKLFGENLYNSDWVTLNTSEPPTTLTLWHNMNRYPLMLQGQIASDTNNPPTEYQIIQMDNSNESDFDFNGQGAFVFNLTPNSITVAANYYYYKGNDNVGTSLFDLGEDDILVRIVALF